ncbi:stage V sporulation protein T [Clostridium felsineum]|uniref:Stage V sporulation protein T n=1 Tax=Clostridium felsineum TaxID=36839 RepID=A0A1S8LR58_9CLOT|nr:stage V sporulation protein T [Clostridium felsineum]MCR3760799.1 stage V sporulation protein T [Clostridium felsineum]URZ03379.1 Stage V sporulation protein T [Clostridium felsineum]URZ08303.1 Stage V sporulation protein T [Clostridium felsineum]URZ13334.1 Stage V sporulation protein T [Clostridium felsineum]URZ14685.1 Stage V sporulation protein T [Clostridium felsineum DSM 794]
MKATGIVRRIDDLGRVVIPKEIRRTLRIREGDPLEIFTDREGGVILKKYSPINELSDFSKEYAESLNASIGHTVIICDRDGIIAVSGGAKKEYIDKRISNEIEGVMDQRGTFNKAKEGKGVPVYDGEDAGDKYKAQVICPILAEGDAVGAVVIFSNDEGVQFGDLETKMAETAASFLGKQMEQ